ncbi:MAG: hypothetical protein K8R53_01590, partial [Bacteroidales bacterium]|nr:hypothetical protein [Bacteroidales bacterium]
MKKSIVFLVLAYLLLASVSSQPCFPEGIIFTTQEEIDNFQANNPGCTEIQGNVLIGFELDSDITNLDGLNVITAIGDSLKIKNNNALISIAGLSNLVSIENGLVIYNNDALTTLAGL